MVPIEMNVNEVIKLDQTILIMYSNLDWATTWYAKAT